VRVHTQVVLALLVIASCTKKDPKGPGRIVALDTDVAGLSGLTQDEHGALWAAGEDGDAVVRIDPKTFGVTRYQVTGGPPGTDLEGIAWVDGTRFVLATETQEKGRLRDVILDGRLDGGRFAVTPVGHVDYARWQLTAPDNHGLEGACHVDGALVFVTELVETRDDRRWAPVALFDPNIQTWTPHRVALTSDTGKLSAIDCRVKNGTIEALAVERHYGISRLIRFEIPQGPESQLIEPTVAADLSKLVSPLPNFEGVAWLDDGAALLVTDNKYKRGPEGPSRLFLIPSSAIR
jgi:hypothetical protein